MKKTLIAAAAVLAIAGCGSSSDSNTSSSAASSGGGGYSKSTASNTTASNTSSGSGKSISIGMYDDYFTPKTITGKPGSTVTVNLKNNGSREHNFKIDGQKAADADVKPGEDGKATVKIPSSGSVQFYCEYHKGLGMVGTVKAS